MIHKLFLQCTTELLHWFRHICLMISAELRPELCRYHVVEGFQLLSTQQLVRLVLHCHFVVILNRRTRFARIPALQVGLCVLPSSSQLELSERKRWKKEKLCHMLACPPVKNAYLFLSHLLLEELGVWGNIMVVVDSFLHL